MGIRGDGGVMKIVNSVRRTITKTGQPQPGLWKLVCKERTCAYITIGAENHWISFERIPGSHRHGIGGRSNSENVQDGILAVIYPLCPQKARFRKPAHT